MCLRARTRLYKFTSHMSPRLLSPRYPKIGATNIRGEGNITIPQLLDSYTPFSGTAIPFASDICCPNFRFSTRRKCGPCVKGGYTACDTVMTQISFAGWPDRCDLRLGNITTALRLACGHRPPDNLKLRSEPRVSWNHSPLARHHFASPNHTCRKK